MAFAPILFCAAALSALGENPTVILSIDAAADHRAIHPEIYGVAFGSAADLKAMNAPLNREGGDYSERYNWKANAVNLGAHRWYISVPEPATILGGAGWVRPGEKPKFPAKPGALVDLLIKNSRAGGASAMVTIPISGWVAKLGPGRSPLWSFSIAKYGAQTSRDPDHPDAGNGIRAPAGGVIAPNTLTNDNGRLGNYLGASGVITANDPTDANQPVTPEFQRAWIQHLIKRWGVAAKGGVRYYLLDNEDSLWWLNFNDCIKTGPTAAEIFHDIVAYATMIRKTDPTALVCGPEEWGWASFFYSGLDQQWANQQKNLTGAYPGPNSPFPDRTARGGMDYMPWLLQALNAREKATGVRLLDVFTFHFYPQEGEFSLGSDDVSPAMQLRRNRSTRDLWDPNYRDPSWINNVVQLIPRMRELVSKYYPGLAIGITEYDWGADNHINGATTQADILGIFGREGVDLATHWISPPTGSPVFKAFQMYRNYDGQHSTFGDTRVRLANSANVDDLSAFAAARSSDGALTVMIIAKDLSGATPVELNLSNFSASPKAQVWQLTAANTINRLADLPLAHRRASLTVPAQSITLLVIPKAGAAG